MFESALTIIVAILALGVLYVVLPVVAITYRRFRDPKTVVCPETHQRAAIQLDANQAAFSAAVGTPDLQVRDCSARPPRGCGQGCVAQVDPVSGKVKAA